MTHSYPSTEFPKAYENASNYEDDVIKTLVVCESHRSCVAASMIEEHTCRSRATLQRFLSLCVCRERRWARCTGRRAAKRGRRRCWRRWRVCRAVRAVLSPVQVPAYQIMIMRAFCWLPFLKRGPGSGGCVTTVTRSHTRSRLARDCRDQPPEGARRNHTRQAERTCCHNNSRTVSGPPE